MCSSSARAGLDRWVITVEGRVQGVGFRPFVHRQAVALGVAGTIQNTGNGVCLDVEAEPHRLEALLTALLTQPPPAAQITRIEFQSKSLEGKQGFSITPSATGPLLRACVLPDLAVCSDCLAEIRDPKNRRHRYPFTNCTACGPRYSILLDIPYDRHNTTMRGFRMCAACRREYEDPMDRRFHAQPNACPACGPRIFFHKDGNRCLGADEAALRKAVRLVDAGGILAVKGLGGFQLIVDAADPTAVQRLRRRKHRPAKPLAVMVPDRRTAETLAFMTEQERELLGSLQAPIVLLRRRSTTDRRLAPGIAPDQPWIGLFLPYTPLHHILLKEWRRPVVVTSGNISEEPLCIDNNEAFVRLKDVADGFLVHDRPIARPVDDSVVMAAAGRRLMIRRARGYAPDPLWVQGLPEGRLACGAQQKNTVAVTGRDRIYVSQHIGDLDNLASQQAWRRAVTDLTRLFQLSVKEAVVDAHPHYIHRGLLHRLEPLHAVRSVGHHEAHVAAVMVECGLTPPVLGLAWDGTGWGQDGSLWGGEFLAVEREGGKRAATFLGFPLPGGEAAIRRPIQTAAGLLFTAFGERWRDHVPGAMQQNLDVHSSKVLHTMMVNKIRCPRTHAVGRLFDGVSALLGLRFRVSYEGEAAAVLEGTCLDRSADRIYDIPMVESRGPCAVLDWRSMIRALLKDLRAGCPVSVLAARFHESLIRAAVRTADDLCRRLNINTIVLSGGCFQNKRLTEGVWAGLTEKGRRVCLPEEFPVNDGGLCVGQAADHLFCKTQGG